MFETEQHKKEMDFKQTQIDEQEKDYQALIHRNEETIRQILDDKKDEIKQIERKNQENEGQVADMGIKSNAELTIIQNKMKDIYEEMETLKRNIADQSRAVTKQETVRK